MTEQQPEETINQNIEEEVIEPSPIPISYYSIYKALKGVFPDQAHLIFAGIKNIYLIKNNPGFGTLGISADGKLFICEEFWHKNIRDISSLQVFLAHELFHYTSADVFSIVTEKENKEYAMINMANNIAMDSRINALICNLFPRIMPELVFRRFYNEEIVKEDWLHKLLAPGYTFDDIKNSEEKGFSEIYNSFYDSEVLKPHHVLAEKVLDVLKKRPKKKVLKISLLGSHGTNIDELSEEDLQDIDAVEVDMSGVTKEELEKMKQDIQKASEEQTRQEQVEGERSNKERIKGAIKDMLSGEMGRAAGKGSKLAHTLIRQATEITEKFDIARFKKMAFDNIFHNVRSQARVKIGSYSTSPMLPTNFNKFDMVKLAAGLPVPLFKTKRMAYKFDKNLLPIYLDVSGSTNPFLPEIVRLIANVSNELDYVWGFSTEIHQHSMQELEAGKLKTTGGTDFDCVLDHAEEHNFEHIVVITDGEAWTRRKTRPEFLKSVVTILFGYARKDNYFSVEYGNTHMIDEVKI